MLYTAKCYWPGVTEDEVRLAAARARDDKKDRHRTTYRGALYLPGDEIVLCLFSASAPDAVKRGSERAGMWERVIETMWIASHARGADSISSLPSAKE